MVSYGGEIVRYNPSSSRIEYSRNNGLSWYTRYTGSTIGNVKSLIVHGKELLLCSDKGVFYSGNTGLSWYTRSTSYKNFIDLQDMGGEILASTDDGHLYYSRNNGLSWYRRR